MYEIDRDLIHVIANEPDYYPESEIVRGFKSPLVHTTNKDEVVKKHFQQEFQKWGRRSNLLVLGDLVDDMNMISKIKESELTSLYVGFFNNPQKRKLDDYTKKCDLLVYDDGNMFFLEQMIEALGSEL